MIAYDELVAALTNWRAKQGLPISSTATPGSGPTAQPGSGPVAKPGSGPTRAAPPAPPKGGGYQPPPLADVTADDSLDVDDSALLEEAQYDNEGNDFAMAFGGNVERDEESTTLGQAPEPGQRDSFGGETSLDPKSRKPW
jgi:hypothetical protein